MAAAFTLRHLAISFAAVSSSAISSTIFDRGDGAAFSFSFPRELPKALGSLSSGSGGKLACVAILSTGVILTSATAERLRNVQTYPASFLRRRISAMPYTRYVLPCRRPQFLFPQNFDGQLALQYLGQALHVPLGSSDESGKLVVSYGDVPVCVRGIRRPAKLALVKITTVDKIATVASL